MRFASPMLRAIPKSVISEGRHYANRVVSKFGLRSSRKHFE
jgi:hypothetical protein